jgi:AraC family transcriptional regulator of adaptative response / DNA-3-methyladenine glycosylase II
MSSELPDLQLDTDACRRARLARDRRFDGEFFLAVRTTGIYCRPICPARAPAEHNVTYFRTATQAARAGYRPCLRCRPESAPGSAAWEGTSTTVRRALRLIEQGALNEHPLGQLAERLGVGERYLRKLFQREIGVSPQAVALNQRLLFAKQLLTETTMPVTEVAFAAGFGSVRRFNSTFREQLRLSPGQMRSRQASPRAGSGLRLRLQYRPPYDWEGTLGFFRRHAIENVEQVSGDSYQRNLRVNAGSGSFRVRHAGNSSALEVELDLPDQSQLMPVIARIRRMFDLDANPDVIAQTLRVEPMLRELWQQTPGIRAPGYGSLFEATVRAVVGQQVSTAAARTICARLAAATTAPGATTKFPEPADLLALDDSHFPMPSRRRETLRRVCRLFAEHGDTLEPAQIGPVPGIGPWTMGMIFLRGSGEPDGFPPGDLGLKQAWQSLGGSPKQLDQHAAAHWRPWGAYAANLLWRSLSA